LAEPLKNRFGADIPEQIAAMIAAVSQDFAARDFVHDALDGYEPLDLMARGKKIAAALRRHLPQDYPVAEETLLASLGPRLDETEDLGMAPFLYLPHVMFVAAYGQAHFECSMRAQYELTQRFTAEFSIRPYLEKYPEATLARLAEWASDPSPHVRRLVSEGTRPRLPWASRLRGFQQDPTPVLALLELLKDDPELYVRRSVANNLNDIGKDHPELLVETSRRWLQDADEERRWLVRHALRSAVKRGEAGALQVLGFGKQAKVSVAKSAIQPERACMGDDVTIIFEISNAEARAQKVLVDFRIHYVKASGNTSPKVFKLKAVTLAPNETIQMQKKVSLAEMTTRKHYPGQHAVELLLNGSVMPLGSFELLARNGCDDVCASNRHAPHHLLK
jgi:3-methyladenine DNA glycosylase AlkC